LNLIIKKIKYNHYQASYICKSGLCMSFHGYQLLRFKMIKNILFIPLMCTTLLII